MSMIILKRQIKYLSDEPQTAGRKLFIVDIVTGD
jgi:hypothetical protein